jgi:acetyl-CoA synthetase
MDYEKEYNAFKWEDIALQFQGLPSGGLNIVHEAIDRHANVPLAEKTALVWLGVNGET